MNAQSKIEVNQSSLLSLKAELLRKKQEVHNAKLSDYPNRPTVVNRTKLKTKFDKANEGVSDRDRKDAETLQEESDALKKSQSILEAKSKLYDELVKDPKGNSGNFLVDFKKKESERDESAVSYEEEDKIESDFEEDEEEWIDFVDCLGRTKRCHRDDLESMKANDEKLRISLFGPSKNKETNDSEKPKLEGAEHPDLCSEDMRREILRQKWEEEERELLDKKNIHYQHVLFDEARTHGVGYYSFSTDEEERLRQQEQLRNLRKETLENQAAAQEAAVRKKKQMQERLRAARRRKRERLGLPPEEDSEEPEEEEEKPEKPEELKREEQPTSTVRPWDIGKNKVSRILTQEEWVEKRREERIEEFAPPQIAEPPQRKRRRIPSPRIEPVRKPVEEERRGAEIPPPQSLNSCGTSTMSQKIGRAEMEKSVEEGLTFIRRQIEEKQLLKAKAPFDFL